MKILTILMLLIIPVIGMADTSKPSSLDGYTKEYQDKRNIVLKELDKRDDLSLQEKVRVYDKEMGKMKRKFADTRKSEYKKLYFKLKEEHSCTSQSPGGVKSCGWKCAATPNKNMYTKGAWVTYQGTIKGRKVQSDRACIKMTVAGKGRNGGSVTATFKYTDAYIDLTVAKDSATLFGGLAQ